MKRNEIQFNVHIRAVKNKMFFRAVLYALIWTWAMNLSSVAFAADGANAVPTTGSNVAGTSAPDYESREALPIAPRRYDGSDDLSKTVFSSVSGNDPFEGLGLDAKAEVKPAAPASSVPAAKSALANNVKSKKIAKKSQLAANSSGKKSPHGKKQIVASKAAKKAAAKTLLAKVNRAKGKANKQLAQQLPAKKRVPASSTANQ